MNIKNYITKNKLLVGIVALLIPPFFFVGMEQPYSEQVTYLDHIRSVAAIIFGVSGAWLAIAYPKALNSANQAKEANREDCEELLNLASKDAAVLKGFIRTMIVSILIIAASLLLPVVKNLLELADWLLPFREYLRGMLYLTIMAMIYIQLSLLVKTLRLSYMALEEIQQKNAVAKTKAERTKNSDH